MSSAPADLGSAGKIRCPVCDSSDSEDWGAPRYRAVARVAGVPVDLSGLDLRHYRCRACAYQFIFPRIPADRLLQCYTAAAANNWNATPTLSSDRFYGPKRALLEECAAGRRVLDLGCYEGGFLEFLGPDWEKHGVEPSAAAAAMARRRGIDIVAATLEAVDWSKHERRYDAVVCFDVMEHLEDPVSTLRGANRLLRSKGVMMIETGDTDSLHWRWAGKSYWYCGIVEHIGFFNKRSLTRAADLAGFDVAYYRRVKHGKTAWRTRLRGYSNFLPYYALRAIAAMRIPLPTPLRNVASGALPCSLWLRDHFRAVLRKRD